MLKRIKNQKGFTLIELIVVIAILGILSLLIVPRVGNYTQKAQISRAQSNLTILKNAIERYNAEHDTALSGTLSSAKLTVKTNSDGSTSGTPVLGPYIDKIPTEWDVTDVTVDEIMGYDPNTITGITSGLVTPSPH